LFSSTISVSPTDVMVIGLRLLPCVAFRLLDFSFL
jgi:hypothetical protein